jgi:hypothetical protein
LIFHFVGGPTFAESAVEVNAGAAAPAGCRGR